MLYNLKVPNNNSYYNLFIETDKEMSLQKIKDEIYKLNNIDPDIKEDIDFVTDYTIENLNMKFFLIKHGFKIIELK